MYLLFLRGDDLPRGSRLSLRIAVLGGFAVALFAILGFRLWNLQVLDGSQYLAEAQNNRTREYRVLAPRGDILARNGERHRRHPDQPGAAPQHLETARRRSRSERAELARLGELAHMPLKKVRRTIAEQEEVAAGAPVTLRRDVGYDLIYYLEENKRRFPGVSVERVFVRSYPNGIRGRARGRHGRRGLRRRAGGRHATRASNRAKRSARAAPSTPTTSTCAGRRA